MSLYFHNWFIKNKQKGKKKIAKKQLAFVQLEQVTGNQTQSLARMQARELKQQCLFLWVSLHHAVWWQRGVMGTLHCSCPPSSWGQSLPALFSPVQASGYMCWLHALRVDPDKQELMRPPELKQPHGSSGLLWRWVHTRKHFHQLLSIRYGSVELQQPPHPRTG